MNKLRVWRLERNLSQQDLAAASGVPRHAIHLAEQGLQALKVEYQECVSKVLGVNRTEIFPANQEKKEDV